jgi:hypothetical protein
MAGTFTSIHQLASNSYEKGLLFNGKKKIQKE